MKLWFTILSQSCRILFTKWIIIGQDASKICTPYVHEYFTQKSLFFYLSLKKKKGINQSVFCKIYLPNTAWSGVFELTIEVWHVKNPKKIPQPALQSKKNFTGPTCSFAKICLSKNIKLHKRLTCTEDGQIVCRPGWKGPLCNQAICAPGCHSSSGYCKPQESVAVKQDTLEQIVSLVWSC